MESRTIYIVGDKDYLMHHGIKGQKWGVENGPPYPLNSDISTGSKLKNTQTIDDVKKALENWDIPTRYKTILGIEKQTSDLIERYQHGDKLSKHEKKVIDSIGKDNIDGYTKYVKLRKFVDDKFGNYYLGKSKSKDFDKYSKMIEEACKTKDWTKIRKANSEFVGAGLRAIGIDDTPENREIAELLIMED